MPDETAIVFYGPRMSFSGSHTELYGDPVRKSYSVYHITVYSLEARKNAEKPALAPVCTVSIINLVRLFTGVTLDLTDEI